MLTLQNKKLSILFFLSLFKKTLGHILNDLWYQKGWKIVQISQVLEGLQ